MLAIAILAAGKGSRMKSTLPKVLQTLAGKTLLERVLENCDDIKVDRIFVIIGHKYKIIRESFKHLKQIEFVLQKEQNGTGHAIQQLTPLLKDFKGNLLVLNGDVPLLKKETIQYLITNQEDSERDATILTASLKDAKGYGRVFADKKGLVSQIIEDKDCNKIQRENKLTNSGIYCFNWKSLIKVLPLLSNNNKQKEIYLTQAIREMSNTYHIEVSNTDEVFGINDKTHLHHCEQILQKRIKKFWMKEGVTFIDESSCTISENSILDRDIIIEPQTHLKGKSIIGANSHLGPGSLIEDSRIGENVKVLYSIVNNAIVNDNVTIGPYSHIRPETHISENCRIGNFVEIKNSNIGITSKINHLSYIGDSKLGNNVNIGAGTITANYDGKYKHETLIGDNTKTGANTVLVAPINIGNRVTIGAGSTLTKNVPEGSLAIGRSKQVIKPGWTKYK
tara:strand:+ start:4109 stop:5458 length:1350 start_codon:yes stop_codon:yes gene_type:complete